MSGPALAVRQVDPTGLVDAKLAPLFDALDVAGEETRIVGGAVRNMLLGLPVADVDLATTLLPRQVIQAATAHGYKAIPTGIDHGTVTVVVAGTPFEVTTLRADVETDGRRAKVAFSRDFAEDALRRDFTVNALSMTRAGVIHDYVGGLADVERRQVRFIGDPVQRIREDYLRVLRFFRFSAAYAHGPLDRVGFDAAVREREGLLRLSRERIGAELGKLLLARRAAMVVADMSDAGLLQCLLGGIVLPARFARACALQADDGAAPDPLGRLAALTVMIAEDAARLREALRLSNEATQRLAGAAAALTSLHGRDAPPTDDALALLLFAHGTAAARDGLILAQAEAETATDDARWAAARRFVTETPPPKLPIGGAEIVARGVPHGTAVGRILKALQARWIRAGFPRDANTIGALLDACLAAETGAADAAGPASEPSLGTNPSRPATPPGPERAGIEDSGTPSRAL